LKNPFKSVTSVVHSQPQPQPQFALVSGFEFQISRSGFQPPPY